MTPDLSKTPAIVKNKNFFKKIKDSFMHPVYSHRKE